MGGVVGFLKARDQKELTIEALRESCHTFQEERNRAEAESLRLFNANREQESRFNKLNEEHHVRIRKLIWKNEKLVEGIKNIYTHCESLYKNPKSNQSYYFAARCLGEICNPPNGQKNLPPDWTNYKTFPEEHEEDASNGSDSSSLRPEDD